MPQVILLMAVTLDGKIAKDDHQPANWTSKADKKIFVQATKKAGVIIMGRKTYQTIGRPLPGRLNVILTKQPDVSQNIPQQLEFTNLTPVQLIKDLGRRGYKEIILGGGASINSLFLKEKLIDEIWLTIEPKIFGHGLPLFKEIDVVVDLKLLAVKNLTEDVIQLKYKVIK